MKNQLIRESFTNSIGQTITVGEEVLAVTTGYCNNVNTRVAVYAGYFQNGNSKSVTVMMYQPITRWRHIITGFETNSFTYDKRIKDLPYPNWRDYYAGLRYGTAEYDEATKKYNKATEERNAVVNKVQEEYERIQIPNWRRSTLQRNRIFKIQPSLTEEVLNTLTLPVK